LWLLHLRTLERRLKALPEILPAQMGCLGHFLVAHFGDPIDNGLNGEYNMNGVN
jgi:hypothetical protein